MPVPASTSAVRCRGEYGWGAASDTEMLTRSERDLAGVVVDRGELENLERADAVRRRHLDFVAFFLAHQRAPDRRRRRDPALLAIGVLGHDQLEGERRPGAFLEDEGGAEGRLVVRNAIEVEQRDLADALAQHADA